MPRRSRIPAGLLGLLLLGACAAPEVRTPEPAPAPSAHDAMADPVIAARPDTVAAAAPDLRPPAATAPPSRPLAAVDRVLASLDARALVGQLLVVYRADNAFLLEHGFGGVLLFKSMLDDPAALRADLDRLQAAAPVGYLVALDQEGGAVSRLDAVPGWERGTPGAAAMGGWSPARVAAEGARIGAALRALGVNLNLAPVLDGAVGWDDEPSLMGRRGRAFGATAGEILPPARAFAAGCREAGVACLAKHFPGYDVAANSDLEPARSGAKAAAIIATAGRFAAVADVTAGVMMASIIYPALGEAPAVLEPAVVDLARAAVGEGLIMTDDLWGAALRAWQRPDLQILPAEYPDADWLALGERALRAGNDLLLVTYPAKAALLQSLLAARIEEDAGLRGTVRTAARRVLLAKQRLGLLAR